MAPGIEAIKKSFKGEVLKNNSDEFIKTKCQKDKSSCINSSLYLKINQTGSRERSLTYLSVVLMRASLSSSERSEKALLSWIISG